MNKNPLQINGKIEFSSKKSLELFIRMWKSDKIPLKFSEDKITKSKNKIIIFDAVSKIDLIVYLLHFVSTIDKSAFSEIKIPSYRKKIVLRNKIVSVFEISESWKQISSYKIPLSENYFFKKIIFDITKNKRAERELLGLKLKLGDKNGS